MCVKNRSSTDRKLTGTSSMVVYTVYTKVSSNIVWIMSKYYYSIWIKKYIYLKKLLKS